ncbi:MAG: hypothetical protein P4L28_07600 [Paludibacteraceae bacterium]|nr:hypothetical protein [Paludibacteraceae bacterium]
MKKSVRKLVLITALIVCANLSAEAQSVSYTIRNEVQTSDRTLEFDLFLLSTDAAIPIQIAEFQAGIYVNPNIENGGTISASIVPSASDMKPSQQPMAITYASNCVKIATRMYPGCGNGTVISASALGTKLCRVRLTNSVVFASEKANLGFNFSPRPYDSRLFYYNSNCVSTQLTTNATNCYSLASNSVLNSLPSVSTDSVNQINAYTSKVKGSVSALGSPFATEHGFVYSTMHRLPTLSDSVVYLGTDSVADSFSKTLSGLASGTFYVRAFASNEVGTVYGDFLSFKSAKLSSELSPANPKVFVASDKLTIDLSACNNETYTAYLLDGNGHTVWSKSLSGGSSYSYGLPGRGVYLVNLISSDGQKAYKIVF